MAPDWTQLKRIAALCCFLLVPATRISIADQPATQDPCETEALNAYWRALKLCQLADQENPRMRCYEAAQQVYVQTLQQCRDRK